MLCPPNDVALVSDMGADIAVGNNMGYHTIAVSHGFMNSERLTEYLPDFIVDNLYDFVNVIGGIKCREKRS